MDRGYTRNNSLTRRSVSDSSLVLSFAAIAWMAAALLGLS